MYINNLLILNGFFFIYLIQKITNTVEGTCMPLVNGLVGGVYIPLATACTDQVLNLHALLVNSALPS